MSELAERLLSIIARGPITFFDLWCEIPLDDASFSEMQAALAELIDAGKVEQAGDAFAFRAVPAA